MIQVPMYSDVRKIDGAGVRRTKRVDGYWYSNGSTFGATIVTSPPVFVMCLCPGEGAKCRASSINNAPADAGRALPAEATSAPFPYSVIGTVRAHVAGEPRVGDGSIAALRDPVLAPAVAQLHARPEQRWTVAGLASVAHVSRSAFDDRFRRVLGRSPIRYLTERRMRLAQDLLVNTDLVLAAVGRRVGYESEEAFSRAFKRSHGCPPGAWRVAQRR